MNCDEAFDVLTSPASGSCVALREHLTGCPRCRDLQEAIAPALSLIELQHSPWNATTTAETAAARLNLVHATRQRDPEWVMPILKYVASLLMAIGVTWLVVSSINSPSSGLQAAPAGVCLWQSHQTGTVTPTGKSGDIVLTCVNCHLAGTSPPTNHPLDLRDSVNQR